MEITIETLAKCQIPVNQNKQAYPPQATLCLDNTMLSSSSHSNNMGNGYWSADWKYGGTHAYQECRAVHVLPLEFGGQTNNMIGAVATVSIDFVSRSLRQ